MDEIEWSRIYLNRMGQGMDLLLFIVIGKRQAAFTGSFIIY
jgi:hypothetical protein